MRFKTYFETLQPNPMQPSPQASDKDRKVQEIWKRAFEALCGAIDQNDAAHQSLSSISFGRSSNGDSKSSTFKGKKAALKRLANNQIFNDLKNVGDPELAKTVDDAEQWLGAESNESENGATAGPTVGELMEKLFGPRHFNSLIGKDYPKDDAKPQVPPQAPKDGTTDGTPGTEMDQNTPQPPGPPQSGMMGQQPQAPGNMQPPAPNNTMPPKPAGAEMGLF